MTYFPDDFAIVEDVTTTEQATGRTVDGAATYTKLVKQSGNLSTGTTNVAHGISGLTKIVRCHAVAQRSTDIQGTEQVVFPFVSATSTFNASVHFDATNLIIRLGTGWMGTNNVLSNLWAVVEYLK